jgi:hypothetical protein
MVRSLKNGIMILMSIVNCLSFDNDRARLVLSSVRDMLSISLSLPSLTLLPLLDGAAVDVDADADDL